MKNIDWLRVVKGACGILASIVTEKFVEKMWNKYQK